MLNSLNRQRLGKEITGLNFCVQKKRMYDQENACDAKLMNEEIVHEMYMMCDKYNHSGDETLSTRLRKHKEEEEEDQKERRELLFEQNNISFKSVVTNGNQETYTYTGSTVS
ncbi:uncharacterized protein LOC120003796 [Tripterygium wilfordii]|uniref:uncharacterized protein LOC120003796 n=1 Tax=Tripterygium wilfordii TaxID=458696 RepID=UPI0018F84568|nr:uncharacterized protein LOC120003796 [Tripterygium wilfordii]